VTETETSLYDRLGGVFAIAAVVDHFSVPETEKNEVLAAFAAHKREVTEGHLATAGT
jgi:hypothetical protein